MTALSRYASRFFTGDFSQGQAFWAILIPSLLVLKSSIALLSLSNVIENPVLSTRLWLPVIFIVFVIVLPLLFYTTAKSIYIASRQFKGGYQSLMLAFALAVVAYMTVAQSVAYWPNAVTMIKIALEIDDYDVTFSLNEDKTVLSVSGQLTYGTSKRAAELYRDNPSLEMIELNLNAGHLHEARQLARVVYRNKLNTHVSDTCLASCMLVLVSGDERTAVDTARLGFHRTLGYDNGYRTDWVIERERKRDQHFYGLRGVAPSYINPIYYKQVGDAYFEPPIQELIDYGVLVPSKP